MSASSRRLAGIEVARRLVEHEDLGSIASTVATATRRRWPNDRWCGRPVGELGHAARRSRASRTRASSSAPRSPRLAGPKATSSRHGRHEELVVGVLEDDADPAADLGEVLLGHRESGRLRPSPHPRRGCR